MVTLVSSVLLLMAIVFWGIQDYRVIRSPLRKDPEISESEFQATLLILKALRNRWNTPALVLWILSAALYLLHWPTLALFAQRVASQLSLASG
jgi:hypothetical protein